MMLTVPVNVRDQRNRRRVRSITISPDYTRSLSDHTNGNDQPMAYLGGCILVCKAGRGFESWRGRWRDPLVDPQEIDESKETFRRDMDTCVGIECILYEFIREIRLQSCIF
jgi:hypothetical protein